MSEMIERVARVLQSADNVGNAFFRSEDPLDQIYITLAIAAIGAMREPTKKMAEAAYRAGIPKTKPPAWPLGYQVMIDVALSGE